MRMPFVLTIVAVLMSSLSGASEITLSEIDRITSYQYHVLNPHLPQPAPDPIRDFGITSAGLGGQAGYYDWRSSFGFDLTAIPDGERVTSVNIRSSILDGGGQGFLLLSIGQVSIGSVPVTVNPGPVHFDILGSTDFLNYLNNTTADRFYFSAAASLGPNFYTSGRLSPITLEVKTAPVPEPSSALLILSASLVYGIRRLRS